MFQPLTTINYFTEGIIKTLTDVRKYVVLLLIDG